MKNSLFISSYNPEVGRSEELLDVDYQGEEITIGFEPRHLLEILKAMKSNTIILGIKDPNRPITITGPDDKGYRGIVTTVHLQGI
jgi:DNA polymerase-3 subunit beta